MQNIAARTWIWILDDDGFFMNSNNPEYDSMIFSDMKPSVYKNRGEEIKGYRTVKTRELMEQCNVWFIDMFSKGIRPCVLFRREIRDKTPLKCFVVSVCHDFVFFTRTISCDILNRDTARSMAILDVGEDSDVSIDAMRRSWNGWIGSKQYYDWSIRYFLEVYNEEKDEFNKENTRVDLHGTGIRSKEIENLLRSGMKWDRKRQIWTGLKEKINMNEVSDVLRIDSIPTPEETGVVTEWYCRMTQDEEFGNVGGRKTNEAFWRILFGNITKKR